MMPSFSRPFFQASLFILFILLVFASAGFADLKQDLKNELQQIQRAIDEGAHQRDDLCPQCYAKRPR